MEDHALIAHLGLLRQAVTRLLEELKAGRIDRAILEAIDQLITEPFATDGRVHELVDRIADLEENTEGTMRETLREAISDGEGILTHIDVVLSMLATDVAP